MKTIILFTKNISLRKHWQEILPKKYTALSIENMETLVEYLKKDEKNFVMIDEHNLGDTAESCARLREFKEANFLLFNNDLNLQHATSMLQYRIKSYENSYLNKISMRNLLISVEDGHTWLFPALTSHLISSFVATQKTDEVVKVNRRSVDRFTKKEQEVLNCITQGCTNGEISSQMHISQSTVKSHIKHLFDKSNIRDRLGLALRYKGCFDYVK